MEPGKNECLLTAPSAMWLWCVSEPLSKVAIIKVPLTQESVS
jgi:hypothetical protein